jgi:predicted TIM-barrel fold metal-dependent hydrolase
MYVTYPVDEDIPYILKVAGEDSLMVGSDYPHRDSSMEYEFPRLLKERAERGEISQSAVQKILYDNARAFYGLQKPRSAPENLFPQQSEQSVPVK